jgi:hypothetical protein
MSRALQLRRNRTTNRNNVDSICGHYEKLTVDTLVANDRTVNAFPPPELPARWGVNGVWAPNSPGFAIFGLGSSATATQTTARIVGRADFAVLPAPGRLILAIAKLDASRDEPFYTETTGAVIAPAAGIVVAVPSTVYYAFDVSGLEPGTEYNYTVYYDVLGQALQTTQSGLDFLRVFSFRSETGRFRTMATASATGSRHYGAYSCFQPGDSPDGAALVGADRENFDIVFPLGDNNYCDESYAAGGTLLDFQGGDFTGGLGYGWDVVRKIPSYVALMRSATTIAAADDHEVTNDWQTWRDAAGNVAYRSYSAVGAPSPLSFYVIFSTLIGLTPIPTAPAYPAIEAANAYTAFQQTHAQQMGAAPLDPVWFAQRDGPVQIFVCDLMRDRDYSDPNNLKIISDAQMSDLLSALESDAPVKLVVSSSSFGLPTAAFRLNDIPQFVADNINGFRLFPGMGALSEATAREMFETLMFNNALTAWEGYEAQRQQILSHITTQRIQNVFFLCGDLHHGSVEAIDRARNVWNIIVSPSGNDPAAFDLRMRDSSDPTLETYEANVVREKNYGVLDIQVDTATNSSFTVTYKNAGNVLQRTQLPIHL